MPEVTGSTDDFDQIAARLSRSTAAERYLNEAIDMCHHNRDLANSVFVDVALRRLLDGDDDGD